MDSSFKRSKMQDDQGNVHRESIFSAQASTAFAKAIIFAAEARSANKARNSLWATIACYYSLFHLSVSLMYTVPTFVHQKLLTKLITERQAGAKDPTPLIDHRYVPQFLQRCESMNLSTELRKALKKSRQMRNFVNYGPHVTWSTETIIVKTREFSLKDLTDQVEQLETHLSKSMSWAAAQDETAWLVSFISTASLESFLTQEDLLYRQWCTPEVLAEAERLRQALPIQIEHQEPYSGEGHIA